MPKAPRDHPGGLRPVRARQDANPHPSDPRRWISSVLPPSPTAHPRGADDGDEEGAAYRHREVRGEGPERGVFQEGPVESDPDQGGRQRDRPQEQYEQPCAPGAQPRSHGITMHPTCRRPQSSPPESHAQPAPGEGLLGTCAPHPRHASRSGHRQSVRAGTVAVLRCSTSLQYSPTQKAPGSSPGASHLCALGRIRTCNLLIRSQMLYPLSYECLFCCCTAVPLPGFRPARGDRKNIT